jgi:hypothetical protein
MTRDSDGRRMAETPSRLGAKPGLNGCEANRPYLVGKAA